MDNEAQIGVNTALKADTYVRSMPSDPNQKQEFNAVEKAEHIIKNPVVEASPHQTTQDTRDIEVIITDGIQSLQEVSIQTVEDYLKFQRHQYLEKEEVKLTQEKVKKARKSTEALEAIHDLPADAIADVNLLDIYLKADFETKQ